MNRKCLSIIIIFLVLFSMSNLNDNRGANGSLKPQPSIDYSIFVQNPTNVFYFGYEILAFGLAGGATDLDDALDYDDAKCIYVAQGQPGANNKQFGFEVSYSSSPTKPTYATWSNVKIHVIIWPDCLKTTPLIYDLDVTAYTNGGYSQKIRYFSNRLIYKQTDYFGVNAFPDLLPAIQAGDYINKIRVEARQVYEEGDRSYLNLDYLKIEYVYSTAKPSAPNFFSLSNPNIYSGNPYLQWEPPSNNGGAEILGYKIYRSLSPGELGDLIEVLNAPFYSTYIDTSAMHGITYYYSVVAFNENGDSPASIQRSIVPTRIPFPTEIVSVSNVYPNPISLIWNQPQWSGLEILRYHLFRDSAYYITLPPNQTQFIDTNITNGVTYTYRVIAENSLGNGTYANQRSIKALGVPAPGSINLIDSGISSNTIYWETTTNHGGSVSLTYHLWWGNFPNSLNNSIQVSSSPFVHSALSSGTMYYYKLETRNELGWNSNTSTIVNRTIGSPSKVRNLTYTPFDNAVNITWGLPEYTYGLSVNYTVYRKIGNASETQVANQINNRFFYDSGISELVDYQYRIVPNNIYGAGESESIIAYPKTRPWKIEEIKTKGRDKAIEITWNITRTGGYPIQNYSIFYKSEEMSGFVFLANTTTNTYLHTVTELSIEYFYYIYAWNVMGQSPPSDIFSDYPDCIPGAPRNFRVLNTKLYVQLSWNFPIVTVIGMSIPSKYHIYRGLDEINMIAIATTGQFTFTDANAEPGKVYYYKVCAENDAGTSLFTQTMRGQLVMNLNISAQNKSNGIEIKWNQVPDAVKYQIVLYNSSDQQTFETNSTIFLNENMNEKEQYRIMVRAFNSDDQLIAESDLIWVSYKQVNEFNEQGGVVLGVIGGVIAVAIAVFIVIQIKKKNSSSSPNFDGWG